MSENTINYEVSVIIPTYNREDIVLNAIDSVLAQTYTPLEILIIDDGSSDGTRNLLEGRSDIRYIYKENGGVSSARNLGIKEAKSEWVAFLDSDDSWLPEKLNEQVQCLKATGCKANFTSISEDGKPAKGSFEQVKPNYKGDDYFSDDEAYDFLWKSEKHPMVQTLFIQKKLLIELGSFNQSLRVAEDTELFYGIILSGEFSYTNKVLAILDRNREGCGLSDDLDPRIALERYRCYIRVQSGLFWRILPKNLRAARHAIARVGYFSSRCAELECAFNNFGQCRFMAIFGTVFAKSFKNKIKSIAFLLSPRLLKSSCKKKWKTN